MASSSLTTNDMEKNQEKKKKKGVLKKGWWAVKGCCSCTRSNDLDPSEEPYLPVLNPVVFADTADRPGCDLEQTPLEDPVDPPQEPSGLKQTAPEEPTDDTSEQQTEGKKKMKGVRARFKKGWQAMKHSCARNNKVVPLPTQPDLDPSDPQPAPAGPRPAPAGPRPAPAGPRPAPAGPRPAPAGPRPAPAGPRPAPAAPAGPRRAPVDPQPAPVDPQRAPVDPQPAPVDPQPAPEDPAEDRPEGKKKKGVRACFKKGWQAMKHSCARNNKVVALATQPDLDPSDHQPAPVDPQPAPVDPQPAPVDPQPAPVDPQTAPVDPQPAPVDPQPAPVDPQPAPVDPQPAPVHPQPAPVHPQPAPEDPAEDRPEGKKKKGVRARFKKRWQAMKQSCARNNKVVALPTKPDLDPSYPQPASEDPQPAPEDPQTAPEDPQQAPLDPQQAPLDPQQAPEGPQPAPEGPQPAPEGPQPAPEGPQPAPEDPAEDRSEGNKKKKGVRARFKKGWQAMKQSCARNNKVVALPTKPDLDPSDHQTAPEDPQPAPVDPQPAPVDPQPAPVDPQPAPVDPQPAPVDPQPKDREAYNPQSFDFTELIEEFYRSLSDYDPYVQRLLKLFRPYSPPQFPAPWRSGQLFLYELDKFEAFSALYEVGKNCLGKGHGGIVYQGTRKSDGLKVAIKFMSKSPGTERFIHVPGYDKPLVSEVALNLMLQKPERCPNIVALLDWFEEDIIYILVLEYPYPCLCLRDFLDVERLSEDQARPLMRQAVNAAQHCIDHDVCHGSLAIRNTVINIQTMTLMFIDFGRGHLASTWGKPDPEHTEPVRCIPAPTWVEPSGETWGRGHAVADTVYGLGRLLLCMMGGSWVTLKKDVTNDSPEFTQLGLTEECFDLIHRSAIASPPDRATLEEFLDHEWFKRG
ncbi:proteoglycan 4-like [Triplophysa dalaica]|uniref:proteoglycan 4-like n=1 Tax=Triplophysa dalaica TaxID=1582913 RepID=UPI0024DFC997|nr:proteoglycan 4-like [Triplophysa dalaica]